MAQPSSTHPTLADAIRAAINATLYAHDPAAERALADLRAALPRAEAADALAEAAEAYRKTMPGVGATGSALDAALRRYRESK